MSQVLGLVTDCGNAADTDHVLKVALEALPGLSGGEVALVARPEDDVSPAGRVRRHRLPGHAGELVLSWPDGSAEPGEVLEVALAVLDTVLARLHVTEEYDDLVSRVDNAQHLANMGDYDWHIASDTNQWSDQLYRIYGHEPQSFNASYESFLAMIHPEDRERIQAVHQQAYATGEPYTMVERIVRPDGEVRHLASNGQVLMDAEGRPLRFRGTCIDITDRVLAEQEREDLAGRMAEDRERRRQALELNDSVVQGLVAATYALEVEDVDQAAGHLAGTLSRARTILDELMLPREELRPGGLVRSEAADFGRDEKP